MSGAVPPTPVPQCAQPPTASDFADYDIASASSPSSSAQDKPYRVEFFLAPWRRSGDKGPAHYLAIGVACAIYLFIVGGSLTYLVFVADTEQEHAVKVMGISSRFLGPLFISLGGLIVIFATGLVAFTCLLYFVHPLRRRRRRKKARKSSDNTTVQSVTREKY